MVDWWSYPINFSNGTSAAGPADLFFKFPNFVLNGVFGYGIILMIWIMSFALSMTLGVRKALMTSSFISFIFSIYLMRTGSLSLYVSIILIVLTIIGAIGSKEEGGSL